MRFWLKWTRLVAPLPQRPAPRFLPIDEPRLLPRETLHELSKTRNRLPGLKDQMHVICHQAEAVALDVVDLLEGFERKHRLPVVSTLNDVGRIVRENDASDSRYGAALK